MLVLRVVLPASLLKVMPSAHSSEFLKAVEKNWRTPRERERLAEEMRRNGAVLDRKVLAGEEYKRTEDRRIAEEMGENLEATVHDFRRSGQITGGARKHLSTSLRS